MQPQGYIPRLIDEQIETLLQIFGAVQIDGPKWCGKTWSGQAHANSMTSLDDQNVLPLAEADPTIALIGEQPHLIDEWQTAPKVRDAVRHDIDSHSNRPGQYILTGSSAPPTEAYEHSGAGRIAHLRMWPMSLVELGKSSGVVSLQGLFASNCPQAASSSSLTDIAEWVCRGGWPASKDRSLQAALYIPRQYLDAVIEDNAPRMGKNPAMTRRTIMSLARNNATAATMKTLIRDLYADDQAQDEEPARSTVSSYIQMLQREYLIEELPCWDAPIKAKNRMRVKPKRYFTDPSLAAATLGLTPTRLLTEGQILGDLFENLAIRDLRIYASAWNGPDKPSLSFYRDEKGLEADIILELPDGRWAAIEIKLGENKVPEAVESLLQVKKKVTANPYARQRDPSFLMVLVGNGAYSYTTAEGIRVVPLSLLGA